MQVDIVLNGFLDCWQVLAADPDGSFEDALHALDSNYEDIDVIRSDDGKTAEIHVFGLPETDEARTEIEDLLLAVGIDVKPSEKIQRAARKIFNTGTKKKD